jgi:rare lipoprotein A
MIRSDWMTAGTAAALLLAVTAAHAAGVKQISGVAAYYSKDYHGLTASGERYDPNKLTCAHRTLPFGTRVLVTDTRTHRSVVVTVNDRGPFSKGRVIDLSMAAAKQLHMLDRGLIRVTAAVQ